MPLVSSVIGSHQISSATNAQMGALNQAINSTNSMLGNSVNALYSGISGANNTLQPYVNAGTTGVNSLMAALQPGGNLTSTFSFDPSQVTSDPGYQFALQQGTQAVQRAAAANGTLNSGGTEKALAQYAGGVASQYENQDFNQALQQYMTNRNAAVQNVTLPISIGQPAASQSAGNIFQGNSLIANSTMNASNQLNSLLEGKGNASAAGSIAQGNLWSNFVGGGALSGLSNSLWNAIPGDNTFTQAVGSLIGV